MKEHSLMVLEGLTVCVTGFNSQEREELRRRIRKLGAGFSLDLTKHCTHLIAKYATGSKYEYAVKWGLPVVSVLWIEDCEAKLGKLCTSTFEYANAGSTFCSANGYSEIHPTSFIF